MIRFVIKSVFWLALAFIVMPRILSSDTESDPAPKSENIISSADKQSVDAILQTTKTAVEIGKFCFDNPSLCENGPAILTSSSGGIMDSVSKIFFGNFETVGTVPDAAAPPIHHIPLPTPREQGLKERTTP